MDMKKLGILLGIPLLSLSLNCTANTNDHTTNASATSQQQVVTSKQDGQILSWLIVLDQNEISAAKLALKRSTNEDVKNYANMMIKDHQENLKSTKELMKNNGSKIVKNADTKDLIKKGKETMASLKSLKGQEFDKAYMNAMVDGHEDALSALDKNIDKLSSDSTIKSHLESTKSSVSEHLEKAKEIKDKID